MELRLLKHESEVEVEVEVEVEAGGTWEGRCMEQREDVSVEAEKSVTIVEEEFGSLMWTWWLMCKMSPRLSLSPPPRRGAAPPMRSGCFLIQGKSTKNGRRTLKTSNFSLPNTRRIRTHTPPVLHELDDDAPCFTARCMSTFLALN
jgi:hypothetical protein